MRVTYMTSVNHTLAPNATVLLHAYNFAPNPRKPAQTLAFAHKTSRKFGLGVGVMLSGFGLFWTGESLGVEWLGGDAAILAFAVMFLGVALGLVAIFKP